MNELNDAIVDLLRRNPFLAHIIMQMRRSFSDKIPTAGVRIMSDRIDLVVNPKFFGSLTPEARVAVLEHECLHIINCHQARTKGQLGGKNVSEHYKWNIAADCAINQFIPGIAEMKKNGLDLVDIENFRKHIDKNAQEKMQMEYYFKLIKDNEHKFDSMDDHTMWEESDLTPEQVEGKIKKVVKVAKDNSNGRGLDHGLEDMVAELLNSKIDWKSQLRTFFSNAQEIVIESTRKKRNRRYGVIHPGHRTLPKLNLAIAVDTSGSVADIELSQFFTEIDRISNENVVIHIIEADSIVKNCYEYKKGMVPRFKGRGGTAYQPAFDKSEELKVDAVIYLGDGDSADEPKKPKMPVLWGMVRGNKPPVEWGKVIQIEVDGRE